MAPPTDSTPPADHTMACMEIWGGQRAASSHIRLPGLDAWLYARPYSPPPAAEGGAAPAPARAGGGDPPPALEGGDIHSISTCATGRITRMVLADVAGHGPAIAAAAGSLRRLMGRFSNTIDQSRFIAAVNTRFHELHGESEANSGLFATAITATYFAPTDELTLGSAGHPRPLIRRGPEGPWTVLAPADAPPAGDPRDLPWGVLEDIDYSQQHLTLGPEDLVLFSTDSLLELRSPDGKLSGERGLIELLNQCPADDPAQVIPALLRRAAAYERGLDPSVAAGLDPEAHRFADDLTILVIRRNSAKPRPSPWLATKAALRILRSAAGAMFGAPSPAALPEWSVRAILGAAVASSNRRR